MANIIRVLTISQTVGATITIGAPFALPNDAGTSIVYVVTGKDTLGNCCAFKKAVTYQNKAGVITIVGGTVIYTHKGILTGTSILESVVGGTVAINITGMAGKTINWLTDSVIHLN